MALCLGLWRVAMQEQLQYRVEALVWILFDVLPPVMMVFLWLTAYQGQSSVAGYSLEAMLQYTLGAMLLRNIITAHVEWDIADAIRQGTLSTYLVRPFNPWTLWFMTGLAARSFRLLLVAPMLAVSVVGIWPYLGTSELGVTRVGPLLASLVMAYLISFCMKLTIGFVAFWLTEITGVVTLIEVTAWVFGGMLLPLELLPDGLRTLAAVLPFQYLYYVPLATFLGRLEGGDLGMALLIQVTWMAALLLLALAVWRAGLRQFEAYGG